MKILFLSYLPSSSTFVFFAAIAFEIKYLNISIIIKLVNTVIPIENLENNISGIIIY